MEIGKAESLTARNNEAIILYNVGYFELPLSTLVFHELNAAKNQWCRARAQHLTGSGWQALSVVLRKVDDVTETLVRLVITVEFEIAAAGERDA